MLETKGIEEAGASEDRERAPSVYSKRKELDREVEGVMVGWTSNDTQGWERVRGFKTPPEERVKGVEDHRINHKYRAHEV
jgi:hypothetical protein